MVSTFCTFSFNSQDNHVFILSMLCKWDICLTHRWFTCQSSHGWRQTGTGLAPGPQGPRPVHLLRSWLLHTRLPIKEARAVVPWKPRLYQRTPPVRPFKKQACVYFYKIVRCWKNSKYDRGTRQTSLRLHRQEIIISDTGVFSPAFFNKNSDHCAHWFASSYFPITVAWSLVKTHRAWFYSGINRKKTPPPCKSLSRLLSRLLSRFQ